MSVGRILKASAVDFIPETNLFRNVPWYGRVILRYLIYYLPFATTVKTGTCITLPLL